MSRGLTTQDFVRLSEMIGHAQMRCGIDAKGRGEHAALSALADRLIESWDDRAIYELEVQACRGVNAENVEKLAKSKISGNFPA